MSASPLDSVCLQYLPRNQAAIAQRLDRGAQQVALRHCSEHRDVICAKTVNIIANKQNTFISSINQFVEPLTTQALFLLHVVSPASSSDLAYHLRSSHKTDAVEQQVSRLLFVEVSVFVCQDVLCVRYW